MQDIDAYHKVKNFTFLFSTIYAWVGEPIISNTLNIGLKIFFNNCKVYCKYV